MVRTSKGLDVVTRLGGPCTRTSRAPVAGQVRLPLQKVGCGLSGCLSGKAPHSNSNATPPLVGDVA
ncbi:hypothetical protein AMTR_s00085p00094520 [Amborella trichopoda]|uniref:Uncharacterized protein n=1 Tax=Amborella trichopoda TaxID=13333 RepID=W1P446_AMBTC|nr:hypothetical protein AMTR_s00085p00094520 [Amborella trichopoda]